MKAVRRIAVTIAMVLLVLAAMSWAGLVLVAPYFFLLPAIALSLVIAFVMVLAASQRKAAAKAGADSGD